MLTMTGPEVPTDRLTEPNQSDYTNQRITGSLRATTALRRLIKWDLPLLYPLQFPKYQPVDHAYQPQASNKSVTNTL